MRRWRLHRHTVGRGHLYQGAYGEGLPVLADWLASRPRNWLAWVQQPQPERELEAVRLALQRGRPFGDERWPQRTAEQLGLAYTVLV